MYVGVGLKGFEQKIFISFVQNFKLKTSTNIYIILGHFPETIKNK